MSMVVNNPINWQKNEIFTEFEKKLNLFVFSVFSPERGFTHPEMLCWSVSIATTLSAKRAFTCDTRVPNSRRTFMPGSDCKPGQSPLTSVHPQPLLPLASPWRREQMQTAAWDRRKTTVMWIPASPYGSTRVTALWHEASKTIRYQPSLGKSIWTLHESLARRRRVTVAYQVSVWRVHGDGCAKAEKH